MAKDDIPPLPAKVPTKRRLIEKLLDVHIAMWLAGNELTELERERLEFEKQLRRAKDKIKRVGLIVGIEGVTPNQLSALGFLLMKEKPTHIVHHRVPSRLHELCRRTGAELVVFGRGDYNDRVRAVVRDVSTVLAAPKEQREPEHKQEGSVWWAVKYARHRDTPVKIVLPNGELIV
jgi:hypothetical protein